VNVADFLRSLNIFDLLVVLVMSAFFIVGFIQGTIRRVLGIASILFSFLLAANLRDPLGDFFAANWTQFRSDEYSRMLAFGIVFTTSVLVFSLAIQSLYNKVELFEKYPVIDETLGGVLGVVQGMLILGAVIVILDSFHTLRGIAKDPDELPFLRSLFETYDASGTAVLFRESLTPTFVALLSPLLPDSIKSLYS